MSETKHTPGPWTVDPNGWPEYFPRVMIGPQLPYSDSSGFSHDAITINCGPSPEMVAEGFGGGTTMDTAIANARLIAAAPDMLTALKSFSLFSAMIGKDGRPSWFKDDGAWTEFVIADELRIAAIAKAGTQ